MTSRRELQSVYHDNMRGHQLGSGARDGITPEVAADLGFTTADQMPGLLKNKAESPVAALDQMIADGKDRARVAARTAVELAHRQAPNSRGSVIDRADDQAAPSAPFKYSHALNGMKVDATRRRQRRGR